MNLNLIYENTSPQDKKEKPKPKPKMADIFKIPKGMEKIVNKKEKEHNKRYKKD